MVIVRCIICRIGHNVNLINVTVATPIFEVLQDSEFMHEIKSLDKMLNRSLMINAIKFRIFYSSDNFFFLFMSKEPVDPRTMTDLPSITQLHVRKQLINGRDKIISRLTGKH